MSDTTPDPIPTTPPVDPDDWDIDAFLAGRARPERTVLLREPDPELDARAAELEAALEAAEQQGEDADRGLDEPGPEQIRAQIADLKRQWEAGVRRVRVRELIDTERNEAVAAALAAGVDPADEQTINYWIVAAACVRPRFTPDQLAALAAADRAGQAMVAQLITTTAELLATPQVTAPFWLGSSTDPT